MNTAGFMKQSLYKGQERLRKERKGKVRKGKKRTIFNYI